jgi:hypothetical protein
MRSVRLSQQVILIFQFPDPAAPVLLQFRLQQRQARLSIPLVEPEAPVQVLLWQAHIRQELL